MADGLRRDQRQEPGGQVCTQRALRAYRPLAGTNPAVRAARRGTGPILPGAPAADPVRYVLIPELVDALR